MAEKLALKRLRKEFVELNKNPVDHIFAQPEESNLLDWHYVICGPAGSPYAGGYYWGMLKFPKEYPYKPPSILMHTKSGRFQPNTRLCLSMSDFHPETWNPMWSVSSILSGLLSFMLDTQPTHGSIESTDEQKRAYAAASLQENCKSALFCKLFPHLAAQQEKLAASVSPANQAASVKPAATQPGAAPAALPPPQTEPPTLPVAPAAAAATTAKIDYTLWFLFCGGAVALAALTVAFLFE